jgi:amino acid adenylation domain-containing protein
MAAALEGFRLSTQQRRAWSLWHDDSSARAWCVLLLEGPLDPRALLRAAESLVGSHEILRTNFHRRPGLRVPFQVVSETPSVSWQTVDPSPAAAQDPLLAADELLGREKASPLGLEEGPIFHLRLCELSGSRHVLLFALPTLCADRGTLHNVARQLSDLYGGRRRGTEPRIQYVDYSRWQEELLESDDEASRAARVHWRQRSAVERPGSIPFERLGEESSGRALSEFFLEPSVVENIDSFCREGGFSTGDFLLACWQTVLWRTTGDPDVRVRTVDEGRRLEELTDAMGLFACALPVPTRFEQDSLFSDVVRSAAEARLQNEEWQEYFGLDEPTGADSAGRIPPAGFEFSERPRLSDAGGVSFSILGEFSDVDDFSVRVAGQRAERRIRIACGADASRSPGAADRLAAHLESLIVAAAGNPVSRAADLPILTSADRRRLLVDWNRTAVEFPRSRGVQQLFEDAAARSPDSPALVFGEQTMSYRDLNGQANSLAVWMHERSVGPGVRVGLALDRSAEMIVVLLAILKAGGAYVPLNPDHPAARLLVQLKDSACALVMTQSKWLEKFSDFPGETVCLDQERHLFERKGASNPPRSEGPEDIAYVMYTSGSRGVPKGVAVRHESLVNYAHHVTHNLLRIDPSSGPALTFATVSTLAADLGNTAIFPSLISGGCLHVVEYETAMDAGLFADYVARNPIDVLKIVPSHFSALLSSGRGSAVLPRRFLILGGEALSWELVEQIQALGGSCEIINHYGPTETTIGSLTYRLASGERRRLSRTAPIGRPIANTEVFLLEAGNQPAPVGVPGELYIGGVGLAQGYANQPRETSERFVPHPFSDSNGARLYRTGDRARYLPDGNVEFLGRMDDQTKIRGFRIEPGEVRTILETHPRVRGCLVITREDSPGDRRLVAYLVPDRGTPPSAEELRGWAKDRLPDYMVPSAFVLLKSLPLTPSGKVDRLALPPPEQARLERPYVAPRTPTEDTIAKIWREVLRAEKVGAEDDFFELGGHSLLVTQVVSRMRKAFDRDLPIRWLFETATVAGLAARVEAAEREDLAQILDELESLPEDESNPLEIRHEPPPRA